MSASATTPPKPSARFTSWKLDILNAAGADPRIPPTYFRMFVRVLAAMNERTGIAILSDDLIADEVPGFKQQATCNRARRALKELGYLTYEPGRGTRATHYEISDKPVAAVMAAIDEARERRAEERKDRNGAPKKRLCNPASVQAKDALQPCKSHGLNPASVQAVHPQYTPSFSALRYQDGTLENLTLMPAALRKQFPPLDEDTPCDTCGKPASLLLRFAPGRRDVLYPLCRECFDNVGASQEDEVYAIDS